MFGDKSLGLNTGSYLRYAEERTFADRWVGSKHSSDPRGSYS